MASTATARHEIDAALEAIAQRADGEAETSRRQSQLAQTCEGPKWPAANRGVEHRGPMAASLDAPPPRSAQRTIVP